MSFEIHASRTPRLSTIYYFSRSPLPFMMLYTTQNKKFTIFFIKFFSFYVLKLGANCILYVSVFWWQQRKNNDNVQADYVRELLLELTRNPWKVSPSLEEASSGGNNIDQEYNHIHPNHSHHSLAHGCQMNSQQLHH